MKNLTYIFILSILTIVFQACNSGAKKVNEQTDVSERNKEAREDSLEYAEALQLRAAIEAKVYASHETDPVRSEAGEDAADDPAIWVNSADPAQSRILGTNKEGGVYVYDLEGNEVQVREVGLVNNIDLRDGFVLGGKKVVLVAASNRTANTITLMTLDPETAILSDSLANIPSAVDEVYGLCYYREPSSNSYYVYANGKDGNIEQWKITGGETLSWEMVRSLKVNSQPEGMVADDEEGMLYIGVEEEGIFLAGAGESDPVTMQFIEGSSDENTYIDFDIEGLALFSTDGQKYLVASSQGNFSYALFELGTEAKYLKSFIIEAAEIDGAEETDGIDISVEALPAPYESGIFVVQDGFNTQGNKDENQNFKYVPAKAILDLLAD